MVTVSEVPEEVQVRPGNGPGPDPDGQRPTPEPAEEEAGHTAASPSPSPFQAWIDTPLDKKLRWDQTFGEVNAVLALPKPITKAEARVVIRTDSIEIELPTLDSYLAEKLHSRVKPSESYYVLSGPELQIYLAKGNDRTWSALFEREDENSLEKPHQRVLQEMVDADEPATPYDQLDDEARELIELLRERQALVSEGALDMENGFDDFRMPIGRNMY